MTDDAECRADVMMHADMMWGVRDIPNLYLCPSASVPPCSQGHPQALSRRSHIQYFTVSNTRFQTSLYPLPYMQGACIATKSFGTCAILKKKDGNGPVHDEEAGSWTESKRMSPS